MSEAVESGGLELIPTSSQTVGPFVEIGCKYLASDRVVVDAPEVVVHGRVVDGDGETVPDFMLEIWQPLSGAPAAFARVLPSDDGSFVFRTAYRTLPSDALPHLTVLVFMRGLLKPLLTRMYFPDDPRTAADPVLALVPADRQGTLIAVSESSPGRDSQVRWLEWNIILQGAGETAFFEW
jgi:protocatechuate 3,4-dioxygenase alpha subunit